MSEFSRLAADEIFASYPEWRTYAREETYDETTYLVIEVPAPPSANVEYGLRIDTYHDEITVSFDFYHAHYDTWNVGEAGMEHEAALPFVQGILSENVGVASWWLDKRWSGSARFQRGEQPEFKVCEGYNRVRVRSWRGTLNEDRNA